MRRKIYNQNCLRFYGKTCLNKCKFVVVINQHAAPTKIFSSTTKLEQKPSKKIRKVATSKPKKIKQQNRRGAKLNIRSPIHTTFKKNVRRYRKRESTGRKTRFAPCTSKTLSKIN